MLYMTKAGATYAMVAIAMMMVVALWVTRGDRKYTEEGSRDLFVTFVVGLTITFMIIVIDVITNIAW